jgi:hydrogenase expression/formation protein HypE
MKLRDELVTLAHGAGGKATHALVEQVFISELTNPLLAPLGDAALIELAGVRLAFTTDTFVVRPLFFPGGDIGTLAVNGTVNDLAVSGARPLALSVGLVIEEGFPIAELRRIASSLAEAARNARVVVATGDTKVVERGNADGVFVNTSGIGLVAPGVRLGPEQIQPGDRVPAATSSSKSI